jgi:ferredoxin-thioredoxin reductase catalytic chain
MDEKLLLEFSEKYAKSQGYKLNPNKEIVDVVIKGLIKNQQKHGVRYCPCVRILFDPAKDRICPCKPSVEEIEKQGHCHCMLFFRKDFVLEE